MNLVELNRHSWAFENEEGQLDLFEGGLKLQFDPRSFFGDLTFAKDNGSLYVFCKLRQNSLQQGQV